MRLLAALFLIALAAQPSTGRVTGVVTDTSGAPIPGTLITLRSRTSEYSAVTHDKGGFWFFEVPPGRYAAIATLQGFHSPTHTDVEVTAGGTVTLKFVMELHCLEIVDYVDMGLSWVLKEADVIAHVRIPALEIPSTCSIPSHCNCTLHYASAIRLMKGQPAREFRIFQDGAGHGAQERPYVPGDEFIAFLKYDDKSHGFVRVLGPHYVFPVRNGRVTPDFTGRMPAGFRAGMPVDEFEKALRAFLARGANRPM